MQIPLFLSTCICIFNKHVFNFNTIFENNFTLALSTKKSLKTSKGQPETVNRRRTDNTMAKKKGQDDKQYDLQNTKDRELAVHVPLVAHVVLLLLQTQVLVGFVLLLLQTRVLVGFVLFDL